jgi:nicotinamide riboside transporter PnuC
VIASLLALIVSAAIDIYHLFMWNYDESKYSKKIKTTKRRHTKF